MEIIIPSEKMEEVIRHLTDIINLNRMTDKKCGFTVYSSDKKCTRFVKIEYNKKGDN